MLLKVDEYLPEAKVSYSMYYMLCNIVKEYQTDRGDLKSCMPSLRFSDVLQSTPCIHAVFGVCGEVQQKSSSHQLCMTREGKKANYLACRML